MPKYLDYHETMPPMPPEAMQAVQEAIASRQADEFGVKPLNAIMGDGQAWCLSPRLPARTRYASPTRPRESRRPEATFTKYRPWRSLNAQSLP